MPESDKTKSTDNSKQKNDQSSYLANTGAGQRGTTKTKLVDDANKTTDQAALQLSKEQKHEDIVFEHLLPASNYHNSISECDPDLLGFEIITGYVFSAPGRVMESLPGTLMLTDCLESCQNNETCLSINYETGLCVLFSSNADILSGALTKSQFPVFTIYAQKTCLGVRPCARAWCIDRVQNYRLEGHAKRIMSVTSRRDCLELCLGENEFICRSANYNRDSNTCELAEMDRFTLAGSNLFQAHNGSEYLENNCAEEPNKLCEFKRLPGRILKTVDSVYQDIGSIDECRDLCLNSPYRCHSYDYGDTGDMVCRLSHHSRATLLDVQDPYLEVPEAATYELSSCYNVTIECGAGDMVARIRTSKLFDGKVYAKGSPKSCAVDVSSSLDFEIRMGYQNLECNVRQSGSGRYMNDVVIQHHDTIVTSSDLGLAVTCQYDFTNKSVTNDVDLGVVGDVETALSEEVIVDSPNVLMRITSRDGSDMMRSAEVGDPLALNFEIVDQQSPYEIFVRELVAMDGADNAEITLIDSQGCPTDHLIMGPILKSPLSGKILFSNFDAFKFPSSDMVQFRALVTPCMPSCEPVKCQQDDIIEEFRSPLSYGRRRREIHATSSVVGHQLRRTSREARAGLVESQPSQEDMLLVQSIQITEKFGFGKREQLQQHTNTNTNTVKDNYDNAFILNNRATDYCINGIGFIVAATIFFIAQFIVIAICSFLYRRRDNQQPYVNHFLKAATNYTNTAGSASIAFGK
ncbi:GH18127 [Drosophila grimshawi]|uniref:GH18127 n=1 Tax=Drosophila grimshawi TaxID=7222 RepID=B4JSG6_DROGR|nr:GH18127 [Drosophila grimshawi]